MFERFSLIVWNLYLCILTSDKINCVWIINSYHAISIYYKLGTYFP